MVIGIGIVSFFGRADNAQKTSEMCTLLFAAQKYMNHDRSNCDIDHRCECQAFNIVAFFSIAAFNVQITT